IIFFVIATVGGAGLSATSNADENTQNAAAGAFAGGLLLFYVIALVAVAGYQIYFWGTSGQTIAMRLFHLRVVDATTGAPIGIGRAVVRWLMTIVNSWACYVGWIWVAFDARKQGWHDKIASSVVLQTCSHRKSEKSRPPPPGDLPPPPPPPGSIPPPQAPHGGLAPSTAAPPPD